MWCYYWYTSFWYSIQIWCLQCVKRAHLQASQLFWNRHCNTAEKVILVPCKYGCLWTFSLWLNLVLPTSLQGCWFKDSVQVSGRRQTYAAPQKTTWKRKENRKKKQKLNHALAFVGSEFCTETLAIQPTTLLFVQCNAQQFDTVHITKHQYRFPMIVICHIAIRSAFLLL